MILADVLHNESSCLALCQPESCLLTPPDLDHQPAELPLVLLIAEKGFPGGRKLHYELHRPSLSCALMEQSLVNGEDEVLLGHYLVQDLQADCSKCTRQVSHFG